MRLSDFSRRAAAAYNDNPTAHAFQILHIFAKRPRPGFIDAKVDYSIYIYMCRHFRNERLHLYLVLRTSYRLGYMQLLQSKFDFQQKIKLNMYMPVSYGFFFNFKYY